MSAAITGPNLATSVVLFLAFYVGSKLFAAASASKWRLGEATGLIAGFGLFVAVNIFFSLFLKNVLHMDIQEIFGIVRLK